jgi:para-aminobenzoate synthetase component 1
MKGTINAGIPDAEEIILSDEKETAEHNTIVDLLRNDLGMVAENITVKRFRYINKIITPQRELLQVSSEITGKLPANYLSELGDIVCKMLPAGSVSGAPKQSTLEIIRKTEREPRGYYTGVFGYFDGEELDSAVMIRFIEEHNGKKYFRSGGGITAFSDPQKEYNEVIEKIYLPFV